MDVNEIQELAIERIWLIPDADFGLVWSDDPAPAHGCIASEAVEYVRKDVHEAIIARQAKAAISGMDAAKAVASSNLEHASRLRAESSPGPLESEWAANALLTEQVAKLEAHIAALQDDIGIHRAAEEMQIALRENAEQERDVLRSIVDQFKAATTRASMNGYGQDDVHHDDSWIDELDHALTRTQHYDAKRRQAEPQR